MSQVVRDYIPAFPKPGQMKKTKPVVEVYPDGREVCSKGPAGREEYNDRKRAMWERQGRRCCFEGYLPECPGRLMWHESTFDHEGGRGMGGSKRDDRIEVAGLWRNGAAHLLCNGQAGSRHIEYNRSIQARMIRIDR